MARHSSSQDKIAASKATNLQERKLLAKKICAMLSEEFPEPECALHHSTPEQLLFATILSAQCTDERVNQVTPHLFQKYPTSMELAQAKPADVEKIIFSTGFYRNKAKSLIACARSIQETYQGELPRDMAGMLRLAGVGRKTANVVLGNAFGIQAGVVVDTHVMRLSQLVGLTTERTPEKIEIDLMQLLPQEVWTNFSHWLILHGRKTCIARRPNCHQCGIRKLCAFGMHEPTDQEPAPKTRKAPQRKVK